MWSICCRRGILNNGILNILHQQYCSMNDGVEDDKALTICYRYEIRYYIRSIVVCMMQVGNETGLGISFVGV